MKQRYLIEIYDAPKEEMERLAPEESLSTRYPDKFHGKWLFWASAIPRVGEHLMFPGWFLTVTAVLHPVHLDSPDRAVPESEHIEPDVSICVVYHENYEPGVDPVINKNKRN